MASFLARQSLHSYVTNSMNSFYLSIIIFSPLTTAMEYVNVTIKAPAGTVVRGDGDLLCMPTMWNDVLIFLLGNYFAHAVTIVSKPGESYGDLLYRTFLALLFPLTGMLDGLKAITRHAIFHENAVQRAGRAEALCMLVRSSKWKPRKDDEIRGIKFTEDDLHALKPRTATLIDDSAEPSTTKTFRKYWRRAFIDTTQTELAHYSPSRLESQENTDSTSHLRKLCCQRFYNELTFNGRDLVRVPISHKIDGLAVKPAEYEVVYVPDEAEVVQTIANPHTKHSKVSNASNSETQYPSTLSANYGLAKALVAVFQTIYSSVTLYRARANQLKEYGYAAFGLTVAPYTVMSIVNLIGNMLTPDYAALHLIESSDLTEAVNRGHQMSATIGRLKGSTLDQSTWTGTFTAIDTENDIYDMHFERKQSSGSNQWANSLDARIYIDPKSSKKGFLAETPMKQTHRQSPTKYFPVRFTLGVLVSLAPLVINGAISNFQPGSSTIFQRGWIMSWLVVGITGFAGLMYWRVKHWLQKEDHHFDDTAIQVVILLVCGIPAFGGAYTAIQMYLDFGACTRLY